MLGDDALVDRQINRRISVHNFLGKQFFASFGKRCCVMIIFALLTSVNGIAQVKENQRIMRVTAYVWPPYSDASLPDQGASVFVLRQALLTVGWELKADFYNNKLLWSLVERGNYHGYLPEYEIEGKEVMLSLPIGEGPLGFAERIDRPLVWQNLTDLLGYRLGVVQGYINSAEIDLAIDREEVDYRAAVDDVTNLQKLLQKRLDLVVIDSLVFEHLIRTDPLLNGAHKVIRMNPRLLGQKTLYVAVHERNPELHALVNQALANIEPIRLQNEYLAKLRREQP